MRTVFIWIVVLYFIGWMTAGWGPVVVSERWGGRPPADIAKRLDAHTEVYRSNAAGILTPAHTISNQLTQAWQKVAKR